MAAAVLLAVHMSVAGGAAPDSSTGVVLRVGGAVVTAGEFQERLNLTPWAAAPSGAEEEKKRTLAASLAAEKILAAEARRARLDTMADFRTAARQTEKEAVYEAWMDREITRRVSLTAEELQRAFQRFRQQRIGINRLNQRPALAYQLNPADLVIRPGTKTKDDPADLPIALQIWDGHFNCRPLPGPNASRSLLVFALCAPSARQLAETSLRTGLPELTSSTIRARPSPINACSRVIGACDGNHHTPCTGSESPLSVITPASRGSICIVEPA